MHRWCWMKSGNYYLKRNGDWLLTVEDFADQMETTSSAETSDDRPMQIQSGSRRMPLPYACSLLSQHHQPTIHQCFLSFPSRRGPIVIESLSSCGRETTARKWHPNRKWNRRSRSGGSRRGSGRWFCAVGGDCGSVASEMATWRLYRRWIPIRRDPRDCRRRD